MKQDDATAVLRDSALIITAATALLFLWGYAFEAYRWTGASVPGLFQPEVAVQERALVGGIVALFMFFPFVLVGWAIDKLSGHRLLKWTVKTWNMSAVHKVVLVCLAFATSVALIRPIANVSDRFGRRLKVEEIILKDGTKSSVETGMYCIGKRSGSFVFVDKISGDSRRIFLVAEDQISSLILNYGREQ